MQGRRVLITGASSGIGLELARLFAASGAIPVLLARSTDKLQALADELAQVYSIEPMIVTADLSQAGAVTDVLSALADVDIDMLVNNAGFGLCGAFSDLSSVEQQQMIQLNIAALTGLTHALLPGMQQRGFGGVLNVASTAAFQPGPWMTVYYASKAYVLAFSEALHEELLDTPLHITTLCPGATATGFADRADMSESLLFSHGVMDAQRVAKEGFEGFRQGRAIVIPGLKNRLLAFSIRLTPRFLVRKIVKRLQH